MYVETDVPPIKISEEKLDEIGSKLPEKPDEKKERYKKEFGLSEELSNQISMSKNSKFFEKIVGEYDLDPTLVASTLEQKLTQLEREGECPRRIFRKTL